MLLKLYGFSPYPTLCSFSKNKPQNNSKCHSKQASKQKPLRQKYQNKTKMNSTEWIAAKRMAQKKLKIFYWHQMTDKYHKNTVSNR